MEASQRLEPLKSDISKKHYKAKDYDYFMKVVLVGNCGAGKSSLMLRFTDDRFNETYVNTIGVDFRFRTLVLEGRRVKMQLWDTAGQEKFRTMTSTYYRSADVIFLVYDVSDQKSYDGLSEYWGREVEANAPEVPFIVLVGTKSDQAFKREVKQLPGPFHTIKLGGTERSVRTIETSAKSSENVYEIFAELGREFVKFKREQRSQIVQDGGQKDKLYAIRESIREGESSADSRIKSSHGDITKKEKGGCCS